MNLEQLILALDQLNVSPASAVAVGSLPFGANSGTAPATESPEEAAFVAEVECVYTERLPAVYPGWESRPQQIDMAKTVARALWRELGCLAEAGTGSGKALALLAPSVLYARKKGGTVIVSTGTHVLQEQYLRKDVPRLMEAIGRFSVALAKGRSNYLCLKRLEDEVRQPSLGEIVEGGAFDDILQWADHTETGDRAELVQIPAAEWTKVCADDDCTKSRCPFYDRCFLFKAKRTMAEAQVVICNHALLIADIAVRQVTFGQGSLLPEAVAIVLDEAHHLETVARENLGVQLTETRLGRIMRDLRKKTPLINGVSVQEALGANERLFSLVRGIVGDEDRVELADLSMLGGTVQKIKDALDVVVDDARAEKRRAPSEEAAAAIDNLIERIRTYESDVETIVTPSEDLVVWAEVERRQGMDPRTNIYATPVEVAPLLREAVFSTATVCSSATLTTGRRFDYFRSCVGVPDDALEFICDSPFDYQKNARLYVPDRLPDPKAPDFHEKIAADVEALLRVSQGRAFVLCTSWRGARDLYQRIAPKLPYRCLLQGEAPRGRLLDVFQTDIHSVLFATASFWEGVDVPGEALSLVVLDKLPFAVPTDPVTRAKVRAIEARGGNAFMGYSVPEAVLKLRQGFGRLIRSQSDRGVVAIFDRRIVEARYGSLFRSSLPPAPMVRRLEDVQRFFGEGVAA